MARTRHPKLYVNDKIPDKPAKQEHQDVLTRNVISCIAGKFAKYENMLKAKTILLPENQHCIYLNAEDLFQRCPSPQYQHIMNDFGLDTAQELWDHIWNTAIDPYKTVERYEAASMDGLKPVKMRAKRKLAYKFVFDNSNEKVIACYYGLAPQARAIIDIIDRESKRILENNPGKAAIFEETELKDLIELHKSELQTKQDSWRIFQYYRGKLIQYSFLRYSR